MSNISNLQKLEDHLQKVHAYEEIYRHVECIKTDLDLMLEKNIISRDYYEMLITKLLEFIFI